MKLSNNKKKDGILRNLGDFLFSCCLNVKVNVNVCNTILSDKRMENECHLKLKYTIKFQNSFESTESLFNQIIITLTFKYS